MKLFTLSKAFLVQAQDASREELDRNRRLYRELRDENVVRLIKEYEDHENLPDSMRLVHTRKDADGEPTLFVSVPAQAVNYSFNWRDRDAFMDNRLAEARGEKQREASLQVQKAEASPKPAGEKREKIQLDENSEPVIFPKYVSELMGRSRYEYDKMVDDPNYAEGYTIAIPKRSDYEKAYTLRRDVQRLCDWVNRVAGVKTAFLLYAPQQTLYEEQTAIVTIFDPIMKLLEKFMPENQALAAEPRQGGLYKYVKEHAKGSTPTAKVEQDVEVTHGIAAYVEAHAADGRGVAQAEYER